MLRALAVIPALLTVALLTTTPGRAAPPQPKPKPCTTAVCQAKKDRQIVAFFRKHPRLAATPAGQRAILAVLARSLDSLRSLQHRRAVEAARPKSNYEEAKAAIYAVFGARSDEAMRVSSCETGDTYDPRAQNGQYLGIFQMGDWERATYGHGPSWLEQAQAAYRYFVASGSDWSPWECKPWW